MSLIRVGLWVEEENSSGGCITLVRVGVSVVLSPSMSRDVSLIRIFMVLSHRIKNRHCCSNRQNTCIHALDR
jgi:hypothetical protein